MNKSLRILLWCLASFVSLNICVATGLIADWGHWYSPSVPYRRQTESLLAGRFALSSSPTAIEHDMAWANGGVQQVWGLGVPFWRLPFELIAKLFGSPAFPDRLALAAAIAIVSYLVIRVFAVPAAVRNVGDWIEQLTSHPGCVAAVLVLLVSPPIMTMCRGPFNVYEEAVVYEYYYCIVIFTATLGFSRGPSMRWYVLISVLAGLAGFIRPTALAYGLSTVLVTCYFTRRARWRWWKSLLGPSLFGVGGLLLFLSNHQRFGSGFEFGHQLTLSSLDMMYILRFPAPFDAEPLWPAAKELFGSMFFVNVLNGFDCHREGIVGWQSVTPRWRHFYGTTFDWTFLVGVIAGWSWAIWRLAKMRRAAGSPSAGELIIPAVWSFIGFTLVFGFLLHYCCMSSRYILDFAPAISVAIAGVLMALGSNWTQIRFLNRLPRVTVLLVVAIWWSFEIAYAKNFFPPTPVLAQPTVMEIVLQRFPELKPIPTSYSAGRSPSETTGINSDGDGWDQPGGETRPLVVLFVRDLDRLVLDVAPNFKSSRAADEGDYTSIRAKVGLEFLRLESVKKTESGKRLQFAPPKRAAYRKGIQTVFLSFVPPEHFLADESPFRLLHAHWNDTEVESLLKNSSVPISAEPALANIERAFPNLQFTRPMFFTSPPDGTNRLAVISQEGQVYVLPNDESIQEAKTLIDTRNKLVYKDLENEEGLLGLAFHPNFNNNGQFLLYYTTNDAPHTSVLARAHISSDDPNQADPASLEELFRTPSKEYWNHNAGTIAFGPDGYLYIAIGDGGWFDDIHGDGQDISTVFGKILRIDVDHTDPGKNYAVPRDNPFLGVQSAAPEIWALRLRNVWRMAFDRQTHRLWAGDVGQDTWEEVDIIERRGNYQWNRREGFHPLVAVLEPKPGEPPDKIVGAGTDPVFDYHHDIGKCIIGGCVYRGKQVPELFGAYLFADHITGQVYGLWYDEKARAKSPKCNQLIPEAPRQCPCCPSVNMRLVKCTS